MDWLAAAVSLKHQNTRALGIIRIVLNDFRILDTLHYVHRQNTIRRKLVVTMVGDLHLATRMQL
jgi:hypothetical protein